MVTYLGPKDILIDQPAVLVGTYDPQKYQTVAVIAEDKYVLTVDFNAKAGIWSVSLENGFNTAGKRWLRLQGKDDQNNTIADQVIDLMVNQEGINTRFTYTIISQKDTLLKVQPIDSSQLNDQQKQSLKLGESLVVNTIELVNDHLKLELNNPLPNLGKFVYVYQPHVVVTKGSKLLWFNQNQLPDHIPGNQLLWVTQTTPLKMKPDDLSQLASDQFIEMPQGSAYTIIGYACIADHFRVTLNQEFPGFGKSGYLYRYHVQILETGKEIAFDNNAITCTIVNTTPLKKRPIDSAYLDSSEKITLPAGMVYGVQSYTSESGHIKVSLTENFPNFGNTGYLYPDFIFLSRGNIPLTPNKTLTYQGSTEVLVNTSVVLKGTFDPKTTAEITLFAEDRYAFNISLDWQKSTWETQLNQGFSDAGYRWLRLKAIDQQGNVTASQVINITVSENAMTVGESLTLEILEDTLFKIVPFDSSSLNQRQKVTIKAGQIFKVLKYGLVDGHLKIVLENAIPPVGNFGYIYTNYVRLKKGSEVFRFDIDEVPDTDVNAQMLVMETTKIKAQPVDSSDLDPQQFEQLLLGQTFGIKGYASVKGHFRVTLSQSIPNFGKVGYVYWQHVKLIRDGQQIGYDPDAITLTVLEKTVLKKQPIDSSQLPESDRTTLPLGRVYGVKSYGLENNHIKVSLLEELPNFGNTGYIFPQYVKFKRGGRTFNPLPSQVELNVPYFSQRDNPRFYWSTCNVTSIAMVMYYYGVRSKWGGQLEDELLQWCFNYGGTGSQTDHNVLSALIRAYGFKTSFSTTRYWSDLKNELINRRPVVIGVDTTPSGHIITVIGYNNQGYIVNDPWGDAYTGYSNSEGRRIIYSSGYMDQVAGPDGSIWAHFIEP